MRMYATRLKEGDDLKQGIVDLVLKSGVSSAVILSVVGSLSEVHIRMAGAMPDKQDIRNYEGSFEIVSLVGTVADDGKCHLHIAISDEKGQMVGGHLKEGCTVHTTAEVVIGSTKRLRFSREVDAATGFDELQIHKISKSSLDGGLET